MYKEVNCSLKMKTKNIYFLGGTWITNDGIKYLCCDEEQQTWGGSGLANRKEITFSKSIFLYFLYLQWGSEYLTSLIFKW